MKFLCHMLGTDQMLDQYRMFAAGSTVNNLNKELVGNTTVSLPSIEEQRVIGEYLESIDNLITLHQREHVIWVIGSAKSREGSHNQVHILVFQLMNYMKICFLRRCHA